MRAGEADHTVDAVRCRVHPPAGRRPQRREQERGSTALEVAVLAPVVMLLVFAIVSGGMWLHGRSIALAAANQAVVAARGEGADSGTGQQAARSFLDRAGDGVLSGVTVSVDRDPGTVTATITASTISLLPGVPGLRVQQTAQGPVEQVTDS